MTLKEQKGLTFVYVLRIILESLIYCDIHLKIATGWNSRNWFMRVEKSTCRSLPGSNRSFSYSKKGRRSAILIAGFRSLGRQDCPAVPTADGPPENLKWTRLVCLWSDTRISEVKIMPELKRSQSQSSCRTNSSPLPLPRPGAGVLLHYMSFVLTGQQKCKCRDCYTHGASDDTFFPKEKQAKEVGAQSIGLFCWSGRIQSRDRIGGLVKKSGLKALDAFPSTSIFL